MCGIVGFVEAPWDQDAPNALDAIASRGPDGSGWFRQDGVMLGHRRLAVIDLVTGAQPMHSPDGRYVIVFNGEIYNYRELREELVTFGHRFTTQSDTEVLLLGFAHWGREVVPKLDGMFAFAIWDTRARKLFAARDRMGIKPFFYSTLRGFTFASTLAPFFALRQFERHIDYEALRDYLAFQTVLAPHSMVREVKQLPPAHWLEYDAATRAIRTELYWRIPAANDAKTDDKDWLSQTDAAIQQSVRRQLVADVPLGAFLSGGIDSSLMVHYMAQAGARPLKTFSVRFAQREYDETPFAAIVAKQYATEHHVFDAPEITGDALAACISALDQPLADPAYVPTFALAQLTRKEVTVAISGDGGDELFGGYGRFRQQESDFPRHWWQPPLRRLIDAGLAPGALLRRSLWGRDYLLYKKVELGPYDTSRKSLRNYLPPEAFAQTHPQATLERWWQLTAEHGATLSTASLMRADLWTYLSENCLMKTDRASMASSLEVRVPLLGNEVIDTALQAPTAAHFNPVGKALLVALAKRHLPESVWNRPKHGFSVPLEHYFSGAWREQSHDWISQAERVAPFLNPKTVQALWRESPSRRSARLAYTFIVLLGWLTTHPLAT